MQQTATNTQVPATIPALNLNAETIRATFQTIKDKQVRACAAMSQIKAITSDTEDKAANDLLVKVRLTLAGKEGIKGIEEMRKEITRELDTVKALLMEPEKAIIEEGQRIKALRDKYAASKVQAQKAEADRIAKEKAQADEIARIKAAMRENVSTGIVSTVTEMSEIVRAFVSKMTLENWDSQAAKLNITPKLKMDKYMSLFAVPYADNIISLDLFAACIEEIKKELPYDKVNAQYVQSATGVLKMWVDDLPNLKKKLEAAAKIKESDPVMSVLGEADALIDTTRKSIAIRDTLQQQQATAAAEIYRQHDQDRLNNEVAATVQQQATTAPKGIRKGRTAIVTAEGADLENTIVSIVRACLSHPKFTGHLKRDRKGTLAGPDKNGNPVYADWLTELLTFAAKEIDADIPGITWKETVTTVAK